MRNTKILSISLPEKMLREAEALATAENRTMSELVREALRSYKREREGGLTRLAADKAKGGTAGMIKREDDAVEAGKHFHQSKRRWKTGTWAGLSTAKGAGPIMTDDIKSTIFQLANSLQTVTLLTTRLPQQLGESAHDAAHLKMTVDQAVRAITQLQPPPAKTL